MTPGDGHLKPPVEFGEKNGVSRESSPPSPMPIWLRLLFPSVTDLLFVLLLVSLTVGVLAPRLLGDAGTGWHIRNGELILQTHSITRVDSFSATMNGQPWYAWEWLFDAAVAWIQHWTGLNGVVFLAALVIASSFTLTFHLSIHRGALLPISLGFVILAIGASAIHLFARPHVFSWLLAIVWFHLLDSSETDDAKKNRRLLCLPVIMLFWANVHGGFVLGFVLAGIYLVAGCLRLWRSKDSLERENTRTWLVRLAGVSALSFVAGLVNPYGYKLYVHVYQYLSDRFLMNHIDEFRSPDFHGLAQQCFAALLLITIVALAAAGRKLRTSELLVVLFAAYSGLYASRNLPVSSILLTLILAPLLSRALAATANDSSIAEPMSRLFSRMNGFSKRMTHAESGFRGHLWPTLAVIAGLVICVHQGRLGSRQLMNAHFDGKRFPVEAVNVIEQRGIRDPIFSEDYWGGYLIYRLYPRNRVFVDDRHDFYGDAFLRRYLRIIHVEPGWESELKALNPNWILMPRESTLTNILKEMPQWRVIHEDENATLFQKASLEN